MKNYKKLNALKNILIIYPIVIMLIGFLVTSTIVFISFKTFFNQEKEDVKKEFFSNLKKVTKQRVLSAKYVLDNIYALKLQDEKEKLKNFLEIIRENKLPQNLEFKISTIPLKVDSSKYLYVYKFEDGKYYYLLENKKNIKEKIKNSIPILFDSFRWGKKGYIFVHDTKGKCFYHLDKSKIGKNRWNLKRNGRYVLQELTKEAIANPNGVYYEYLAFNPNGKKPIKKISFIVYDKDFNLTIGSGVYLNELQKSLNKIEKQKKKLLNELYTKLLTIIVASIIIMGITLYIVSSIIVKKFQGFSNQIAKLEIEKEKNRCIDSLTKFIKKDCMKEHFKKLKDENVAIIDIDINAFREINSLYGMENGDKIIYILAQRLRKSLKSVDIIGRGKIDEFIVMLKYNKKEDLDKIIKRIYNVLTKPIKLEKISYTPSIRIGIALNKKDSNSFLDLLNKASTAANSVKSEDIKIGFFDKSIEDKVKEYLQIKNDLTNAIEENKLEQFEIYYQPQIDRKDKLVGMEALIRWRHPKRGLISPGVFLPIAINEGLIKKIDMIVMQKVIAQVNEWLQKGYNPGIVSCNVSMKSLESKNYINKFKEQVKDVNTKYFGIEITEESLGKNIKKVLDEVKNLGVSISLDDFGTGYSNLKKLKEFPIDKLKIDKSFIDGIPNDESDVALTKIIIEIGKILNMKLIAEGVENIQQKDFVFNNKVEFIQGYFYSPPLPADEIEKKYFIN